MWLKQWKHRQMILSLKWYIPLWFFLSTPSLCLVLPAVAWLLVCRLPLLMHVVASSAEQSSWIGPESNAGLHESDLDRECYRSMLTNNITWLCSSMSLYASSICPTMWTWSSFILCISLTTYREGWTVIGNSLHVCCSPTFASASWANVSGM